MFTNRQTPWLLLRGVPLFKPWFKVWSSGLVHPLYPLPTSLPLSPSSLLPLYLSTSTSPFLSLPLPPSLSLSLSPSPSLSLPHPSSLPLLFLLPLPLPSSHTDPRATTTPHLWNFTISRSTCFSRSHVQSCCFLSTQWKPRSWPLTSSRLSPTCWRGEVIDPTPHPAARGTATRSWGQLAPVSATASSEAGGGELTVWR